MKPQRARDPFDWTALLGLIRDCFAYMDARIDPPSSMHRLTAENLAQTSRSAEVWVLGSPPFGCVILTPKDDALYVGKLAIAAKARGQGHARSFIALAETRAKALGLAALELEVRIELTENHVAFEKMGFTQSGQSSHAGFDRPTSLTFRKALQAR